MMKKGKARERTNSLMNADYEPLPESNGPNFFGTLLEDDELDGCARKRRKKFREISISRDQKEKYRNEKWAIQKFYKNKIRMRKDKNLSELFEDEVWLLFYSMGFTHLNKDRNFKISADGKKNQIDVFAKDGRNVFIVECKTKEKMESASLGEEIDKFFGKRDRLIRSVRKAYKEKKFKVSFLIITKNYKWTGPDKRLVEQKKSKNFFAWNENHLTAFETITRQLGASSKYQLYSILFREKKIKELSKIQVPAIYGGGGKFKHFCFIIQPEKLLHFAYVHRREESDPDKIGDTYQRMVRKKRVDDIRKFVDSNHFFPNNIIINFTKKPQWDKIGEKGEISYGILTFPMYYGCAWVIDGQHRLFGYSNSEKRKTHTFPVVAFNGLKPEKEATLFIEINKEQKNVNANLLWDLYSDIYSDAESEKYKILATISSITKKLTSQKDSPLYSRIIIPSLPKKGKSDIENIISLSYICDGIKENRLIEKDGNLLFCDNYSKTVDFAFERLKIFFKAISEKYPEDWDKGDKGILSTETGIRIILSIFRQFLMFLDYKGLKEVYHKKDTSDFQEKASEILEPIINRIKKMSDEEKSEIKRGTTKAQMKMNTQKILWELHRGKDGFGSELWKKAGWSPAPPKDKLDEEKIKGLLDETEIDFKNYLINKLKSEYPLKWWKMGIPKGVKDNIEKRIMDDIKLVPFTGQDGRKQSSEEKMVLAGLGDKQEIIKANWNIFKETFANNQMAILVHLQYFSGLRNKFAHPERKIALTEIERNFGYWSTLWIKKCIRSEVKTED